MLHEYLKEFFFVPSETALSLPDLNQDSCHLCALLRTDRIKAHWFFKGGKQVISKVYQCKKLLSRLFIVDNRNVLKNFYLKDDYNGKLRLEVIIDNFLDAAATVDLPTESE